MPLCDSHQNMALRGGIPEIKKGELISSLTATESTH